MSTSEDASVHASAHFIRALNADTHGHSSENTETKNVIPQHSSYRMDDTAVRGTVMWSAPEMVRQNSSVVASHTEPTPTSTRQPTDSSTEATKKMPASSHIQVGCLVAVIGPPGSGKSELLRKIQKRLSECGLKVELFSAHKLIDSNSVRTAVSDCVSSKIVMLDGAEAAHTVPLAIICANRGQVVIMAFDAGSASKSSLDAIGRCERVVFLPGPCALCGRKASIAVAIGQEAAKIPACRACQLGVRKGAFTDSTLVLDRVISECTSSQDIMRVTEAPRRPILTPRITFLMGALFFAWIWIGSVLWCAPHVVYKDEL